MDDGLKNKAPGARSISCHGCRYYWITWESRHPYGCRAHGFKTNRNPALAVFQASGITCQLYTPKKKSWPATEDVADFFSVAGDQ